MWMLKTSPLGHTLLELLFIIAVLAIITTASSTSMLAMWRKHTFYSDINRLASMIERAQFYATWHHQATLLCPMGPDGCIENWQAPWHIVQLDATGQPSSVMVSAPPRSSISCEARFFHPHKQGISITPPTGHQYNNGRLRCQAHDRRSTIVVNTMGAVRIEKDE